MGRNRLAPAVVQLAVLLATGLAVAAPDPGETPVPAEGIVVRVDRVQATVLVDHGPIEGLLASARTEFPVEDVGLLEGIQAGDHIRFVVAPGSAGHVILTITELNVRPTWRLYLVGLLPPPARVLGALFAAVLLIQWVWMLRELRQSRAGVRTLREGQEELRRSLAVGLSQLARGLGAVADRLRLEMSPAQRSSPPGPAYAARPTADDVDLLPLVVVQRGENGIFRHLSERLDPARVRVIWDRRRADRRTDPALTLLERRRRERRRSPPATWAALRYLVSERDARHPTVVA
jgi:hypothetical protein